MKSLQQILYGASAVVLHHSADAAARKLRGNRRGTSLTWGSIDPRIGEIEFEGKSVRIESLPSAPSCPCLLVAFSPEAQSEMPGLRDWWERSGVAAPQLVCSDGLDEMEALCDIFAAALSEAECTTKKAAATLAGQQVQILTLRQENEELEMVVANWNRTTAASESILKAECRPAPAERLEFTPGQEIVFALPYPAFGLARIDLILLKVVVDPPAGRLNVILRAKEDGQELADGIAKSRAYFRVGIRLSSQP